MKILITGSHGFLGHHLVERLKDKHELLTPNSSELNVQDIVHLYNYLSNHKPEAIIHLAAVCGGIGANQKSPADFFAKNSMMSINILAMANHVKVKKLITLCSVPTQNSHPFPLRRKIFGMDTQRKLTLLMVLLKKVY